MANLLAEGFWPCEVLSGEAGTVDGVVKARINVRFTDGPNAGRPTTYEDRIDAKSSLYVMRSMTAVGWQGKGLATFADDVAAWIAKTGGKSTAEIKHIPTKKGTIWDKCNRIGGGPRPMVAAAGEALNDAEEMLRKAMQDDGLVPSDAVDDDSIPF